MTKEQIIEHVKDPVKSAVCDKVYNDHKEIICNLLHPLLVEDPNFMLASVQHINQLLKIVQGMVALGFILGTNHLVEETKKQEFAE